MGQMDHRDIFRTRLTGYVALFWFTRCISFFHSEFSDFLESDRKAHSSDSQPCVIVKSALLPPGPFFSMLLSISSSRTKSFGLAVFQSCLGRMRALKPLSFVVDDRKRSLNFPLVFRAAASVSFAHS